METSAEPNRYAGSPATPRGEASSPYPVQPTVRTIIEARAGWQMIDFRALWCYRELLGFLVWRDIQVRYKQRVLGALWAIIQPVMMIVTIFFGRFGGMSHNVEGADPVFVYAALLPRQLFAGAVGLSWYGVPFGWSCFSCKLRLNMCNVRILDLPKDRPLPTSCRYLRIPERLTLPQS